MTCPEATGACTSPSDGECIEPKEESLTMDALANLFVQGYADHFVITWGTGTSYAGQTVALVYRPESGGELSARVVVAHDTGTTTSATGLTAETFYHAMVRVESATEVGEWVSLQALISSAWTSESEVVEHLGVPVLHGTDTILIG